MRRLWQHVAASKVVVLLSLALALTASRAQAQPDDQWRNRLTPSRPSIDTRWEPLALPIGEMELLETARRLGLSREQIIAFEASLPAYQQQANDLRRRSNQVLASVDPSQWRIWEQPPPLSEIEKLADTRLECMRGIERLDSGLLDELAPMLSESQQALLVRERSRRDRRRLQTDGNIAAWVSQQPLLVELADVVQTLELPPDQREAAVALAAEFESQATQRMRAVFENVTTIGKDWQASIREAEHPHMALSAVATARIDAMRDLVDAEYQWRDRIAGVLAPEQAAAFRAAHARACSSARSRMDSGYVQAVGEAVAQDAGVDDSVQKTIAAKVADILRIQERTLPEIVAIERRVQVGQMLRVFGEHIGRTMEDHERERGMYEQLNALQQEYWNGYTSLRSSLTELLGDEQAKAIEKAASEKRAKVSGVQYDGSYAFGDSNLVTFVSMYGSAAMVLPANAPRCGAGQLAALGLSGDEQSIATGVLNDFADQWNERGKAFTDAATPLIRPYYKPDEVFNLEEHERASQDAIAALRQLQPLDVTAGEQLRTVISDARLADLMVAAQAWACVAAPPRNCPAPMEAVGTSHYRTIASRLDRVDPAAVLLSLNAPPEAAASAWDALIIAAPAGLERVWSFRVAVADAYLVSNRSMRWQQNAHDQQRKTGQQVDWRAYMPLQRAGSEACVASQRARREHLTALASLHAQIASLLPGEFQLRYLEAVSRAAFPDAWTGVDRAQRLSDQAQGLPDLTQEQRQQMRGVLGEQAAALRTQAQAIERLINEYALADDMTREARSRTAPLYGEIEQTMFEREEAVAATLRLLRPILTAAQMRSIESTLEK